MIPPWTNVSGVSSAARDAYFFDFLDARDPLAEGGGGLLFEFVPCWVIFGCWYVMAWLQRHEAGWLALLRACKDGSRSHSNDVGFSSAVKNGVRRHTGDLMEDARFFVSQGSYMDATLCVRSANTLSSG